MDWNCRKLCVLANIVHVISKIILRWKKQFIRQLIRCRNSQLFVKLTAGLYISVTPETIKTFITAIVSFKVDGRNTALSEWVSVSVWLDTAVPCWMCQVQGSKWSGCHGSASSHCCVSSLYSLVCVGATGCGLHHLPHLHTCWQSTRLKSRGFSAQR